MAMQRGSWRAAVDGEPLADRLDEVENVTGSTVASGVEETKHGGTESLPPTDGSKETKDTYVCFMT